MTSQPSSAVKSDYADANGLKMYYEIRGTGAPIIVLHGAYMSIDQMGEFIPRLAENRQVIAFELQGHMRTADVDRSITYEGMADDIATAMKTIGIPKADVFGFSLGAGVAVQIAIRHPEQVNKLIAASVTYNSDGLYPEVLAGIAFITPEVFAGTPFEAEYMRLSPRKEDWPKLIHKLVELDKAPQDWPKADIQAIKAPTFLISGDADIIRQEHAVEMFRLLGGGVIGDMNPLSSARLAILPGTSHLGVMTRASWLTEMVNEFLDSPVK